MAQRAGRAACIVDCGRKALVLQLRPDLSYERDRPPPKFIVEANRFSSPLGVRIDRAGRDGGVQHLLETQCLCAELEIRMRRVASPDLVLHGERGLSGSELHDIGFAPQAESLGPKRQSAQHADTGPVLASAFVHALVCELPTNCVDVLLVCLFHVYEGTLPRTVGEVLNGRDRHIEQVSLVPGSGRIARQSVSPSGRANRTTSRLIRRAWSTSHQGGPGSDRRSGVRRRSRRTSVGRPRRCEASERDRRVDERPRCRVCCRG